MGPKKDNPKPRGLWISPPRRWLFVLIPLLAVIACGTFIRNSYVSEQFRYSLSERFFSWRNNKDFADEVGADKNSAFRPVEGPEKVFGGDEEKSKRPDDTASDLAAVRAELAKSIAAEESARRLIAYLEKWLKDNEMISAGALDAERERSDGIARDLAAVRSELADRITAEASARNEIAQLTKRLEASENEWTTRLTAERGSNSGSLAAVRAELADSITAVASARTEIEQLTQRLAANEKDWTTKLDAERERSRGLTRDLATVRAELAERIAAEASARGGISELEKLSKANETEWTSRFSTELERSEGMAQDLENDGEIIECSAVRGQDRGHWAWREIDGRRCWYRGEPGRAKTLLRWSKQISPPAVSGAAAERPEIRDQAEHAKRIAAEASVRPTSDFTLNSKTESVPNDRGYVRPLVEQTPIPLPRPAPRIQPQTTATNDQSPHSANTEQPTKAAAKDVRDTRDNPTREAKQRRADDHPFGSVFDSVR